MAIIWMAVGVVLALVVGFAVLAYLTRGFRSKMR